MRAFLLPCVIRNGDVSYKSYVNHKTLISYTSILETKEKPRYLIIDLYSPINNSFLWLWFNIGGVADPDSLPTSDNTIYYETDLISPAFVASTGIGKTESLQQMPLTNPESNKIWEKMSFQERLDVWYYIEGLVVKIDISLIAWWFRNLFKSSDFPDFRHEKARQYRKIIQKIVEKMPSYHIPLPKISKDKPIRCNRIDRLYYGLLDPVLWIETIPICMYPILNRSVSIVSWDERVRTGKFFNLPDEKNILALAWYHGRSAELWKVRSQIFEEMYTLKLYAPKAVDSDLRDPEVEVSWNDGKWVVDSSERYKEGSTLHLSFYSGNFTRDIEFDNVYDLYKRVKFTPSPSATERHINRHINRYRLVSDGDVKFVLGGKVPLSGRLYTMISRSPMVRAIVESHPPKTGMEERETIPVYRILEEIGISTEFIGPVWSYLSGDDSMSEHGSHFEEPTPQTFNDILGIWRLASYFAIPIDSPFMVGYIRGILEMTYNHLLNKPAYLAKIVSILKDIPRSLLSYPLQGLNTSILHRSEVSKSHSQLGYVDQILSSLYKPGIPPIISTRPYNDYKRVEWKDAEEEDLVILWNEMGRSDIISLVYEISEVRDEYLECNDGDNFGYRFSEDDSVGHLFRGEETSSSIATGITILRPKSDIPVAQTETDR